MNTVTDEAVYGTYRATLRSLRKSGGDASRAGARKQQALKVASDRYRLPISAVKKLVREQDAKAGITHEHPQRYLLELSFMEVYSAAVVLNGSAPCATCGTAEAQDCIRPRLLGMYEFGEEVFLGQFVEHRGGDRKSIPWAELLEADEWKFVQSCYRCKMNSLVPAELAL